MQKSTITIDVTLDPQRMPEQIHWAASDSTADMQQRAKALCLAFWDGADRTALRIDLWTKDMMVDEMGDFYYQMLLSMGDTFRKATRNEALSEELKTFAHEFQRKFRDSLSEQQAI